ncbi:LOW QUALITY PROTEIN: probable G-protein coupled receptor Mth-like 1 [Macrobrachium rosenbergii]|uniref:LOW QUALITY PROTEIN: probable G-protein coupled receptor Mth-like 1 n=1 Tax=Macrobrachium rosenbergii TaxID=79674 RepID=UPI0034D4B729
MLSACLLVLLGIAVATEAQQEGGGGFSTKKSVVVTPRAGLGDGNLKEKLIKLEKAEEKLDKEISAYEAARRENATKALTQKGTKKSNSNKEADSAAVEALCNNALQVDFNSPGSVTLCTCGVNEVHSSNGSCSHYAPGTSVLAEKNVIFREETPVTNFRVRVQDLDCSNNVTHRQMVFSKGTFYLRNRGDIVLTEGAAHLVGLRINDYCIDHFLDEEGSLSWRMKACIPHPVVPRCCPPDQVFRNGTCQTGHLLLTCTHQQADPRGGEPITWPVIRNQIHRPTCGNGQVMRTVALDINGSYLLALANGLAYRWYTHGRNGRSEFHFCPDFCVDGIQSIDGTMEYFTNFCYTLPEQRRPEKCDTDTCVRKCCKPGEIMSVDHYRCLPYAKGSFQPPVSESLDKYEVVYGRPPCAIHVVEVNNTIIDSKGNWVIGEDSLTPNEYCMDTFASQGTQSMKALICWGGYEVSAWMKARMIIFPVCHVISLVFLAITVGFYLLAPVLMKQGGWHQLAYVLSLMLAYASTFSLNIYHTKLTPGGCVGVALVMQFGFLSTFFWLCVMCFDIENKIRSLKEFRAYVPLHPMAYVAFGFGGPVLIGLITLLVHATVPIGTPGVIVSLIGISRCWFVTNVILRNCDFSCITSRVRTLTLFPPSTGDMELFVYFYGPIAALFLCNIALIISTTYNYMQIEQGALGLAMKAKNESPQGSQPPIEYDRQKQTRKNFAEFKHKFLLLSLMCFCWITEVLSWKIPPPEIWALTDILNSLQGLFIFAIFLTNRRNLKILKARHPRLYSVFRPVKNLFRKLRGVLRKGSKSGNQDDCAGLDKELSISSEFSELSENVKPSDPTAT